jgi:hypothetical protein
VGLGRLTVNDDSDQLDPLRTAWHGQLLGSKHGQRRSIQMSFGTTFEADKRVASQRATMEED